MDLILCRGDEAGLDLDAEDSATLQEALALSVGSPTASSPLASPHVATSHSTPPATSVPHALASDEHAAASHFSSADAAAAHPQSPHVTASSPHAPDPNLHAAATPLDPPEAAALSLQQDTSTDFVHVDHPSAAAASSTAAEIGDRITNTSKSGAGLFRLNPPSGEDTPMPSDVTPSKPAFSGLHTDSVALAMQQQQQQLDSSGQHSKLGPEPSKRDSPKSDAAGLAQHKGSLSPSELPGLGTTTEPSPGVTNATTAGHGSPVQMQQPLLSEAPHVEVPVAAGPEARPSAELASIKPAQAQRKVSHRPCSSVPGPAATNLSDMHALIAAWSQ